MLPWSLLLVVAAPAQERYSIRLVAPLEGHVGGIATGVDDHACVVGSCDTTTGFLWSRGVTRPLSNVEEGARSRVEGIGPEDVVVGALLENGYERAARFSLGASGPVVALGLGTAPGDRQSIAEAVNAHGLIVGCTDDQVYFRPAVYEAVNGRYRGCALPLPHGHVGGVARDVNDAGRVVGFTAGFDSADAATWTRDLGAWRHRTLAALVADRPSEAVGVDARGLVGGHAVGADGRWHLVLWDGGQPLDLGRPTGCDAFARALGPDGALVGYAVGPDLSRFALFHPGPARPEASFVDLRRTLPPGTAWTELREAADVNAAGAIAGHGVVDGFLQSFLMTPVRRELEVPGRLFAGAPVECAVHGAAPGATVELFRGRGGGETPFEGEVQSLDVAGAELVAVAVADGDGTARFVWSVPATAGGRALFLQAFDRTAGEVSNVEVRRAR